MNQLLVAALVGVLCLIAGMFLFRHFGAETFPHGLVPMLAGLALIIIGLALLAFAVVFWLLGKM